MKHLTNLYDPRLPDAKYHQVVPLDSTPEEEWKSLQMYLRDKIIGDPKATDFYSVEQLKAMKMVGIYRIGD